MTHKFAVRFVVLASLTLAACTKTEKVDLAEFSAFKDIPSAPSAIKASAGAIVRIRTAHAYGTGSFISADGQLLTNNHVLGIEVCPREGCYASITQHHERGATPVKPVDVFLKPLHVSVGLDMAVLQAFALDAQGKPGPALGTPEFLTFEPRDAASLVGEKVYVVGHPEGHLKKWSTGEVAMSDGAWFQTTAFSLPGNSGSPILNESGQIVGLLHRGPSGQDLIQRDGVVSYSIATASDALVAAMNEELPATMRSVLAATKDDDVVANETVFLNARTASATVPAVVTEPAPPATTSKSVLTILADACDKGLARNDYASPEELAGFHEPCLAALGWIECEADALPAFAVCPTDAEKDQWRGRYSKVFDRNRALNGELWLEGITFAMASLETSASAGKAVGEQRLRDLTASAQPRLDPAIAPYLAAFGFTTYEGTVLADYVRNYDHIAHYELSIPSLLYTALWLGQRNLLSRGDTITTLRKLIDDDKVSLGPKLAIEEVLHNATDID